MAGGVAGGAQRDLLIGQVVAERYEVLRLLGRGGMGAVYEVRHLQLGRSFAMKTMAPALAAEPEALARFQREAKIVAALRHPNIVEVIGWEALPDGSPCYLMEYLDGEDLAQRIRRTGPLDWDQLWTISDQVLSALAVTHREGIVHRDLKPQNIFLTTGADERAKLLDFGVSKVKNATTFHTADAQLIGTPAYMSPEQAAGRGKTVDAAADVWAMGVIVYQMATARLPFAMPTPVAMLHRICYGDPDPLQPARPDAPAKFVQLISNTLNRDPGRRIIDAERFRSDLAEALGKASRQRLASPPPVQAAGALQIPAPPPLSTATPAPAPPQPRASAGGGLAQRLAAAATESSLSGSTGQALPRTPPIPTAVSANRRPIIPIAIGLAALAGVVFLVATLTLAEEPDDGVKIEPRTQASPHPEDDTDGPSGRIELKRRPASLTAYLDDEIVEGNWIAVQDEKAHALRCEADGYFPAEQTVSSSQSYATCYLKPLPRTKRVLIKSKPTDATVFVGGEKVGRTPRGIDITEGVPTSVELRKREWEPRRVSLLWDHGHPTGPDDQELELSRWVEAEGIRKLVTYTEYETVKIYNDIHKQKSRSR